MNNLFRRRRLLQAGVAAAALFPLRSVLAQSSAEPRVKSPAVWLDLDQKALDDAYDQSVWATNTRQLLDRYAAESEAVRARIGAPRRFAYGPTAIEALDVFTTKAPNAPVNVFVHGGAWRSGLAANYAFAAEMFVTAGAHHVVPDFNNVLETGGDLMVMADQVRRAVAWVYRNANSFGGDPRGSTSAAIPPAVISPACC